MNIDYDILRDLTNLVLFATNTYESTANRRRGRGGACGGTPRAAVGTKGLIG